MYILCVYMCMSLIRGGGQKRTENGMGCPGGAVINSCELCGVGAGNSTQPL